MIADGDDVNVNVGNCYAFPARIGKLARSGDRDLRKNLRLFFGKDFRRNKIFLRQQFRTARRNLPDFSEYGDRWRYWDFSLELLCSLQETLHSENPAND